MVCAGTGTGADDQSFRKNSWLHDRKRHELEGYRGRESLISSASQGLSQKLRDWAVRAGFGGAPARSTEIRLEILGGGAKVFAGSVTVGSIKRDFATLVEYLYRDNEFPKGCFLLRALGLFHLIRSRCKLETRCVSRWSGIGRW